MLGLQNVHIENAARHECSHLIMGKIQEFETGDIIFNRGMAGAEIFLHSTFSDLATLEKYLERRLKVLLAGVCGEAMKHQKVYQVHAKKFLHRELASDDNSKIRELIRVLVGIKYSHVKDAKEFKNKLDFTWNWLWDQTASLVETHAGLIEELCKYSMDRLRFASSGGTPPEEFVIAAHEINKLPCIMALKN